MTQFLIWNGGMSWFEVNYLPGFDSSKNKNTLVNNKVVSYQQGSLIPIRVFLLVYIIQIICFQEAVNKKMPYIELQFK